MYELGFVSKEENSTNNKYIEMLEKKSLFNLHDIDLEESIDAYKKMDALIIQSDAGEVGNICELLIEVKKQSDILVWILSDELPDTTRIIFLQLGADGILDSKFKPEEYLLILRNSLNRHIASRENAIELSKETATAYEDFKLVPNNLSVVIKGDEEIRLTNLEFKTIELLYEKKSEAIPYQAIYQQVWRNSKDNIKNSNYRVANLIFHLRKKIEKNPLEPKYIKTVRSKGYMLSV